MDFDKKRNQLVTNYIKPRVSNKLIINSFQKVPRHKFVLPNNRSLAYENTALPIGKGQTISQPSLIAIMLDELKLSPRDKVLDIGTGSGYQAALLSRIVKKVVTVEIIPELSERARKTIKKLGYKNIRFVVGDGTKGFLPEAPYDAVVVAAAGKKVPRQLEEQLKEGGRIIIPIRENEASQTLIKGIKQKEGTVKYTKLEPVAFVPLIEE